MRCKDSTQTRPGRRGQAQSGGRRATDPPPHPHPPKRKKRKTSYSSQLLALYAPPKTQYPAPPAQLEATAAQPMKEQQQPEPRRTLQAARLRPLVFLFSSVLLPCLTPPRRPSGSCSYGNLQDCTLPGFASADSPRSAPHLSPTRPSSRSPAFDNSPPTADCIQQVTRSGR